MALPNHSGGGIRAHHNSGGVEFNRVELFKQSRLFKSKGRSR